MKTSRTALAATVAGALALAPTALATTPYYTYQGHDSEPQRGIVSSMWFARQVHGPKVTLYDYFSKCGEFRSGMLTLRNNRFSFNQQWSNGFGLYLTGHITGTRVTGTVRTWGPTCRTSTLSYSLTRQPGTAQG